MGVVFTNNAETTLAAAISSTSATSISVTSSSTFPTVGAGEYFYATISDGTNLEIVKITAVSGTTWTVVRASDNTTARTFANGSTVQLRTTAALLTDIQENIASKSANQTVYNATAASSATAYDVGINPGVEANAMVFLDGVMQHHDTFSFSGSTLTFDAAPVNGTKIEVIVDNLINLQSSNLTVDTFTATSNQTAFTLSDSPAAESNLIVFINGVFQNQAAYTISNNTLTLDTGVVTGRTVTVYVINPVNIGTPSDGTVTSAKLSGNITTPGTLTVGSHDVAFDSPTFVVDNSNSRVGLGTASPSVPVDIVGDVKMSANLTVDTNTLVVNSSTNKVGIGQASPAQALDVVGAIKLSDGILSSGQAGSASVFNEDGTTADFRVESTSNTHMLFVDGGLDRVGINTSSPTQTLDVNGTVELNNLTVGGAQGSDGQLLTSTGSGVAWEDAPASGPTFKTFGTDSIMVGDNATGTIDAANNNTGVGVDVFAALTSGDNNTAVGMLALTSNTTASNNDAFGYRALTSNTTGTENVSIGRDSMYANTEGDRNVAVGYAALDANTTADNNTAVGNNAMTANTTGYDNVGIGRNSLDANTEGHSNTAVGESSLTGNTTGDRNVAIGQNAMSANSTGSENVAIGRNALDANTTADANTAVGDGALTACTTGNNNVCIGHGAGESIDIGSGNTCVGANAGDGLNGSNGKWNTAIGFGALSASTAHFQNTAVGQGCLSLNTAHGNTGVGARCLTSNTSGSSNNGFGYFCMDDLTTGDDNVGMGTSAARYLTTGGGNSCFGNQAGQDLTTGDTNTLIGRRTGQNITTADNNTAVGVDAMEDATTAHTNTCVGSNAGANLTSGSNNLLLGYAAGKAGSPGGQRTTHSNRIGLGDGNIQTFSCQVALSVASDERDKTDFTALDLGLDFVKQMKPYTYKWDKRHKYVDWDKNPDTDLNSITHDGTHKEDWLDIGFKAQDIEVLEKAAGYDKDNKTNLAIELSDDGKAYSMKYEKLVPILVKAIQELEAKVAALESK